MGFSMKKIYIITCHNVYNAGASLQAYALMKYLQNQNYNVEIIDYMPDYLRHYKLTRVNPRFNKNFFTRALYLFIKVPKRLLRLLNRRKINYDRFTRQFLCTTSKTYSSNDELKKKLPHADFYIAGSDQIWNPLLNNGKDPSFYLDFVPIQKKKIAYAASFSVKKIPEESKKQIKTYLNNFNYVSVRESSALEILKDLKIDNAINVVDPVFLLDNSDWEKFCKVVYKEKYVLLYDFDHSKEIEKFIKKIATLKELKIYSILDCEYADKSFSNVGPDGFLSLVNGAEIVVSNSFHATAFSIIFNKPFFVFKRNWHINTRIEDLIKSVGLENRLVLDNEKSYDYINIIPNWEEVNTKMSEKIKISKSFLENSLES